MNIYTDISSSTYKNERSFRHLFCVGVHITIERTEAYPEKMAEAEGLDFAAAAEGEARF